ncbi:MAG: tRNA (adenosine(37)-N6)-dimethylallyltransferase MiaA [Chitinispirillaceae bacterium]|nr:tRNA (adenosine(37)-N6)-dimethylallyltransferase MiaA [Chitinispirillaceae bacterium]
MEAQKKICTNSIVVCGPTAAGKTRLGVHIALEMQGEIISCDSRQVYRGMDIGTGKDLADYRTSGGTVPTHMIDIADPEYVYTVRHYQRDFAAVFNEIITRQHVPVIVGGSGLYLESILRRYDIPDVPENAGLRAGFMARDKNDLDRELAVLDPARYASTDRSSKKRIVRSLEISYAAQSGQAVSSGIDLPHVNPIVLCVTWERPVLHQRIRQRLLARLDQGLVDEVKQLLGAGILAERFKLFGMEYKHVARYVAGEISYESMVADLQHDIQQLAKRQETWFRGMERRGVKMHWIRNADADEAMGIIRRDMSPALRYAVGTATQGPAHPLTE